MFSMAKSNKDQEIYRLFQEIVPEYIIHKDYIQTTSDSSKISEKKSLGES